MESGQSHLQLDGERLQQRRVPATDGSMTVTPLSDAEYVNLYQSLNTPQAHVCSRQCDYKQVSCRWESLATVCQLA